MASRRAQNCATMSENPQIRIIIIEAQSETVIREVLRELGTSERSQRIFVEKVENMGDTYNVSGQAGAVGPDSKAEDTTMIQTVQSQQELVSDAELHSLALQLEIVRLAMRQQLLTSSTVEQDGEVGQIAKAQIAANSGDKPGAISHLKMAGQWTMEVAKDVGAEIVARVIASLLKP
jgi:hypothetical protein